MRSVVLMNNERDALTCPVCGGRMTRVKVLPKESGALIRFKCTCGHCEDLNEGRRAAVEQKDGVFSLEGFQELP